MLRSLLGFLPWIVYAVIATSDNWRYGAVAGLVIALAVIVADRRAGKDWDQMVIESSAAVFFTVITLISFVSPDSPLMPSARPWSTSGSASRAGAPWPFASRSPWASPGA